MNAHVRPGDVSPDDVAIPVVSLKGIEKSFPGVKALQDVSIDLYAGEVHMIMGENGAGKSTLMKILCGAYASDAGEFFVHGQRETLSGPQDARRFGIAVIFQEFSLVPHLDVAQNILLGREPRGLLPGQIDLRALYAEAQRYLDMLGSDIDARTPVHRLRVAEQQMVEIAKALSQDARVLVLDEPTSALSDREVEQLFRVIRALQSEGVAMAYISHRMAEVFELGNRITVIRDGQFIGTKMPAETSPDEIVTMMVGRAVDMSYGREFCKDPGECVIELRNVSSTNGIKDVSLHVRRGEIVGLSGLVGSGRTEVARAIFGADAISAGEIRYCGGTYRGTPTKARDLGIALIPENRKTQGLALARSVRDNMLSASLGKTFSTGWFSPRRATEIARSLIERLRVATPSPARRAGLLSGGNQQKVVIGKWLNADSDLFIFDEPTRGIDVGAKAEIFTLIDGLVKQGKAVLMISSELSEIINVCDRAYVMKDKRVVGELDRSNLRQESVMKLAVHHG
ncbi:sugar ABC transporter ATP-binding protein [Phreatobacter stygius]|uniref:Sugar ABC transporter ATP-binding protein n=1 Tax=Phreatobacter stygius TaxID=1940610 RepID=A0A4D7AW84_9HYPH|nr:sugar ABC transporter ATP-binding protein [Phreatobacter stygius]QCI65319.1 sugar ABC transporter ATP-binding protein [Phreatobacter stygius]